MSTHALIGVSTGAGTFKARFVHWDGYPEAVLPKLNRTIKHYRMFKVENPLTEILGNHWSELLSKANNNHDQVWYTEANEIDHDYLYLIDQDTLKITSFIHRGNSWIKIDPDYIIEEKHAQISR